MNLKGLIKKAKEGPTPGSGAASEAAKQTTSAGAGSASPETVSATLRNSQDLPCLDVQANCIANLGGGSTYQSGQQGLEQSVWLLEDFLPEALALQISCLLRDSHRNDFLQLRGKRTAKFGGDPGPPFQQEPLPNWLQELCEVVGRAIGHLPLSRSESDNSAEDAGPHCLPNHVLVNQYRPGEGIMPHTDGPSYNPWAAIVSLDGAAVFDFWRDHAHAASGRAPALSLLVPPRSLLVFSGQAYAGHLHGISDRRTDEVDKDVRNWSSLAQRWRDQGIGSVPLWAREQLQVAWSELGGEEADREEETDRDMDKDNSSLAVTCDCSIEEGSIPVACLRRADRISLTLRRVPPPPPARSPSPTSALRGSDAAAAPNPSPAA
mmetsp:Transcript_82884/g.182206  ORF Transcript_82884/g.182206 Transcript_82884/m.182206 type:complete len:378 (+) Transcript_82884:102-1235(+)|eukprot:CAMPEP_0206575594 /NCGR_PEP_ID=MMETSP0325_2-20121206/30182_1 /ASSEMBLY_ACC=CAM_ASM_000347 /TAXON_ID=2866 /ORGANISM="Crypthecodinium cohnii, Strain Seligo" /LENGTH=377 /DNA_ID=CAMNT_0054080515 /DNA_START=14 /DNA_END=1147 /DNA_ORIENTATION=+